MTPETREAYARHVRTQAAANSRMASSYLRALDLLGPVLARAPLPFSRITSIWAIDSIPLLAELYAYVLEQQRLGEAGIFAGHPSPSYADNGFYSAALRNYRDFLIVEQHQRRLWEQYRAAPADPYDLGRRLDDQPLEHADLLAADLEPSDRTGRDVLRTVKTRVNQDFFRRMVLDNYGHRCCLTGIPIPQVLRASHIVPWAEDDANRLNPANGLCLSATYDAAFDAHLITLDEGYQVIFSPGLKNHYTNQAFKRHFTPYEGQRIELPAKYHPAEDFLSRHRRQTITM